MAKQDALDRMYMKMAYNASEISHARRRQVGAILVIPEEGRFEGVNGMPSGFDNNCEHEGPDGGLVTKQACLHAESNAIMKVARSRASSIGGTMYCTLAPCIECAKLIIQAGIVRVVYSEVYPIDTNSASTPGVQLLEEAGIQVDNLPSLRNHVVDEELTLQDEGRYHDDEEPYRGYSHP
ncbi:MAG: cytidine deaminase [Hydrogenophaga sp.]|uniref:deoxycytidylate deaminase n=1 Tax=Hydrogenophaga sp. TaxID=1904254 RepID=UPI002601E558|nr:deaminase [Hydrogenophaga sp.]MCV0439705.1 cytidine deaminase [Hydrogenophaga sp.]